MMILQRTIVGLVALVILMTLSLSASAVDPEDRNPLGCRDVGYAYDLRVLRILPPTTGDSQSLFFLFNLQNKAVNLYQMRQEDSMRSVYMNHIIRPRQWAVLSTSEPRVSYICTVDDGKSSYGKIVDCENYIKVCQYVRVKYGMNNRGNYWVVNSNTRGGAVNEVLHYGIIPR